MMKYSYLQSIAFSIILITNLAPTILNSQDATKKLAFDSIINANTYIIEFDGNNVFGHGTQWLIEEALKANYFLVGERHGTSNIPNISGAIYAKLSDIGYNHAALEIGRYAAIEAQELIKNGGYESLKNYLESPDHFQAIAFLDWAEESMLLDRITKESPLKEKAIWGLDQEFLFGFKMYLERLEKEATTSAQRELLSTFTIKLIENQFLLGGPIKADLGKLKGLFVNNNYASKLLEALLVSNKIYSRFRGEITKIESNTLRENLMKQNFVDLVSNYEKDKGTSPKVFFKFGGFHSAPTLGHSTLGNFVEEWAFSRNESAFNIYLDAVSGRTLASGQDNPQGGDGTLKVVSYFGSIGMDETNTDSKHIFAEQLKDNNKLFLIDLRPIRIRMDEFKPFINAKAKSLIIGFDAYLGIPNVTPGTPFKQE